jgi:DNA-binding response OmpR family regulator
MARRKGGQVLQELPIVLVIEDDKDLQAMLEDGLRDGEFEPAIAASGEEAITLLKAFRSKYSALVTDIALLGQTDGWRVARAAREVVPGLPIVYITGGAGNEWDLKGVPGSVLLTKPFTPTQLVAAVAKLLNVPPRSE